MKESNPYRVRKELSGMQAYEPGKPIPEIQVQYNLAEPPIKLASNENPYSPPEELRSVYEAEFERLNRYPDGGSFYLSRALSEKYDWPAEGIVLGGGSDEVLDCLAKATLGEEHEVLMGDPSFAIYQLDAMMMGATPVTVPLTADFEFNLEEMLAEVTSHTRWVCLPNPNNPTSRYVDRESLNEFYRALPEHCLLLLDEAYFELMDLSDYPSGVELLKNQDTGGAGVVVLRTFSKAYAIPGLRVGYGLMSPELAEELHKVRPPFNVTRPGQAVAVKALEQEEFLVSSRKKIERERENLLTELEARNVEFVPPVANFFLMKAPGDYTGNQLFKSLLPEGVIVRSMAGYGLEEYVRVTVGKPEENELFLEALDKICEF